MNCKLHYVCLKQGLSIILGYGVVLYVYNNFTYLVIKQVLEYLLSYLPSHKLLGCTAPDCIQQHEQCMQTFNMTVFHCND